MAVLGPPPGLATAPPGAAPWELPLAAVAVRHEAGSSEINPTDIEDLTPLLPNATTALWQRASGAWELAPASDPLPETTTLGSLWIATSDAAGVIEILDRRGFAADTVVPIQVRARLPVP